MCGLCGTLQATVLGEGKQGTELVSDSKAGRVDGKWVQLGAELLKFTAIHTWGLCPFPSLFAWQVRYT